MVFVAFHKEPFFTESDEVNFSKDSLRISESIFLTLRVKLLYACLSEGSLVLCHVALALLLSAIRSRANNGSGVEFGGKVLFNIGVDFQAAACIKDRLLVAFSISSQFLSLTFKVKLVSIMFLNVFQFVFLLVKIRL